MKNTIEERKDYAKVIARACVDEEFKKRLLAEPTTVLAENGIEIPEEWMVKVVERKEKEIHRTLPQRPLDCPSELSDEQLEKLAGGVMI